jgi:FkbM family methyltransferase
MLNVFIDGGGNKLLGVEWYLGKFPEFDKVFVFEPNPLFHEEYADTEFILLKKAIWTKNCTLPFFISKDERQAHSSLIEEKLCRIEKTNFVPYWHDKPIDVECVDFGQWIRENINTEWNVTLKLDIEGAEYDVLNHMLKDGSLEYIDKLFVEFHNPHLGIEDEVHDKLVNALTEAGLPPHDWD